MTTEVTKEMESCNERNYGIDLLRIVAMIMIPALHIMGHGGILTATIPLTYHNEAAYFLETAAYCAVNVYALISGYVGYGRKQRYSNIIYLYLQVLFYTIITTVVFAILRPDMISSETIVNAIFPFAYQYYWYFAVYFCLFFFMPFLNAALEHMERRALQGILVAAFMIFSVLPTIFCYDFPGVMRGYSFLWIAILYVVGAYIRKYQVKGAKNNWQNLLGYVVCVLITWLSKIGTESYTAHVYGMPQGGLRLLEYHSPTIVLCAVFLLLFFANLNCNRSNVLVKFIRIFAPASFGVYLFHEEPLIRATAITNRFVGYVSMNIFVMPLAIIGTALGIWLVGSLVDLMRMKLFELLRVRQFCNWVEKNGVKLAKRSLS